MRFLGVVLLGCALLLSATNSVDNNEKRTDVKVPEDSLLQILTAAGNEKQQKFVEKVEDIIGDLQKLAGENDFHLRVADDAKTHTMANEKENGTISEVADDRRIMKKGCEDHQVGEKWGTPEHDNCFCEGPDRFCHHVDCLPGSEIVHDANGLWNCSAVLTEEVVVDDAETAVVAEEETDVGLGGEDDNGLIKKEGCEGHQIGDQWGSSDHDNCICGGADRICYRVDCLPGSEFERDYNGIWNCKIDFNKRDIADADIILAQRDGSQTRPSLTNVLEGNISRKKRQVVTVAAVATVAPIFGALFSAGSFIYGIVNGQQRLAELKEINGKLDILNRKLDGLAKQMDGLGQQIAELKYGQEWAQAVSLYGRDIQILRYYLGVLNRDFRLGYDGKLVPTTYYTAANWADWVLRLGPHGVSQALFELNDMMIGSPGIFGGTSLFFLYEGHLDRDSDVYWSEVKQFLEFAFSIQTAGCACLATALNIKEREDEVANVTARCKDTLNRQLEFLQPFAMQWPTGTYGLPRTNTGCPVAAGVQWREGMRYQDTEDDDSSNEWIEKIHFDDDYWENNVEQKFCMKTINGDGDGSWPTGDYCIFKKGDCPGGFQWGQVYWDDEDDDNHNSAVGELPDGAYDSNTRIQYCCRDDGDVDQPILLPSRKPFYLFRFKNGCQEVENMYVRPEWFRWDDEDDKNHDTKQGAYPFDDGGVKNHRIGYCYYSATRPQDEDEDEPQK